MNGIPKPGEWWRLANGKRALIYAVHGQHHFEVYGAIEEADGNMSISAWTLEGVGMPDKGENLSHPIGWRDELAPIWRALKPEWRYIAMDKSGSWYSFQSLPSVVGYEWHNSEDFCLRLDMLVMPTPTCQWDETLTERPEES